MDKNKDMVIYFAKTRMLIITLFLALFTVPLAFYFEEKRTLISGLLFLFFFVLNFAYLRLFLTKKPAVKVIKDGIWVNNVFGIKEAKWDELTFVGVKAVNNISSIVLETKNKEKRALNNFLLNSNIVINPLFLKGFDVEKLVERIIKEYENRDRD